MAWKTCQILSPRHQSSFLRRPLDLSVVIQTALVTILVIKDPSPPKKNNGEDEQVCNTHTDSDKLAMLLGKITVC